MGTARGPKAAAPDSNQPENDKGFWNDSWRSVEAAGYAPDAANWENEREEMLMDFIRPWLPQTGVVAEVGCGKASLLARIGRERSVELVAVDYAEVVFRYRLPSQNHP